MPQNPKAAREKLDKFNALKRKKIFVWRKKPTVNKVRKEPISRDKI